MNAFEEVVRKATEQLEDREVTDDRSALRGIGYALLALAVAINTKIQEDRHDQSSPILD